jgi:hypothetical protein
MSNPDDDATLGAPDTTPPQAAPESRVSLTVPDPEPTEDRMLTLEELLTEARLPEDYARICLRADLEAELTLIDTELASLVDAEGNLVDDDDERDLGDAGSAAARAQALADRRRTTAAEMAKSVRFVRFRGLSAAASAAFDEEHAVKDTSNARKVAEFNDKLVAATAVNPTITVEQMAQYRDHLGPRSIAQLTRIAQKVCTRGGVDVPKSPVSSLSLTPR